jgi:hypothetical protein
MNQRLALAALFALTVLAYWPGLAGPLVLDDRANLEPLLRWMHGEVGWHSIVFSNLSGPLGRPVSMASFLANVATTGESVYWMKATNLALHLACGGAIYALLSLLVRLRAFVPGAPDAVNRWVPCFATAFWLLHPLLVSTVLYVVQRMAMLAALFTLVALLAYLHGRIALRERQRATAGLLLGIAVPVCIALAVLSKENGALALAMCGLMEWLVFRPGEGQRRGWASRGFIFATLVAPAVAAVALTIGGHHLIAGGYSNRSFTLSERLLTQPRVLWDYVRAILVPRGPSMGLYHDDFAISHGWFSPATTLPALLLWGAVALAAWRLRRRVPAFAIGLGIFLVGQALESTVFPLLMYFEHRVYLPSIGIVWAAAGLATAAGQIAHKRMHHGNTVFVAAPVALVLALSVATFARAAVWRSQLSILDQALATHPDSRWLRMDLIAFDMAQRPHRTADALRHTDHLMAMRDPLDQRFGAMLRLSIECMEGTAITSTRIGQVFDGHPRAIEPDLLVGLESLAGRISSAPCGGFTPHRMADELSGMLDRSPFRARDRSMWRLRFQAGRLYWLAGDPQAAVKQARLAYPPGNTDPAAGLFLAGVLLRTGNDEAAAETLDKVQHYVPAGDARGQQILGEYRALLAADRAAKKASPGHGEAPASMHAPNTSSHLDVRL